MKYLSGTVPINNASVSYNDEIPDSEFIVNFKINPLVVIMVVVV